MTTAEKYIPIPISEFLKGMKAPASLYLKLIGERFVMVFKEGQIFDPERLDSYKDKQVESLWVIESDYSKISHSSIRFAAKAAGQPIDSQKKIHLISNAAQAMYRNFEVLGLNLETFRQGEEVTAATVKLVQENINLVKMFESLNELDDHIVSQSVAASILAPILGILLGWESETTLKKLALGGLLHDIGKRQIPKELLTKPLIEMNHAELMEYQSHTTRGADMLKRINVASTELLAIVLQHHERKNGSGYPHRLLGTKIHPFAKVVGLVSEFLDLVMPNPASTDKAYSPQDALKCLQEDMGMPFDRDVFQALEALVLSSSDATAPKSA